MTVDCDYRLFAFCVLLIIGMYAATSRNYFRFVLINFRGDVSRKRPVVSEKGTDSERPTCSFSVFREYLRQTRSNYLPGSGTWTRRGGTLARFHPDLCSLSYGRWVPRQRLARCFARQNASYVVVLGDSNARRLYQQIRRTLSVAGRRRAFVCDDVRHHHDDVTRLPAHRCTPNYYGIRWANYFHCTFAADRLPVASLLVQYLPMVLDVMPINATHNSTETRCVDEKTSKFVVTQASTVQVNTPPCMGAYYLGQSTLQPIIYTTLFTNIHGSRNMKNNRKKRKKETLLLHQ